MENLRIDSSSKICYSCEFRRRISGVFSYSLLWDLNEVTFSIIFAQFEYE